LAGNNASLESTERDKEMTPAQKAKRTKLERKYWAEYEEALKQANEDFYKFARTLYPKRDAKIDAAEAKMDQIIADARAEFEETRSRIMDEFENNPEVLRLDKVRREISAEQSNIYKSKVAAIQV
jgi:F0F1-type ATP synthase membrane subunit b/b'